ncbi:MAG: 6-bladed beta-propeller [Lentimicrobium sp.]|jgi:hypothetical protein|nr:6-bladed beta-propeller [Lentimicrobium sp.]
MQKLIYIKISCALIVLLSTTILHSCNKRTPNKKIEEISVNLNQFRDTIRLTDLFSSVKAVRLETNEQSILGEFNKIVLYQDTLYISTGTEILVFDIDGNFIRKHATHGKGPGEYLSISDILIDPEKQYIIILDATSQKIITYDKNFGFISEFSTNRYAMNFAMASDGNILLYCGYDTGGAELGHVEIYKNGKLISSHLPVDPIKAKYLHFRMFDLLGYYGDHVVLTIPHNDTVYYLDSSLFYPRYTINIGNKRIPDEIYKQEYKDIADFSLNTLLGSNLAYGIFGYLESGNHLFFRYDERKKEEGSPYGRLEKYFVLHHKATGKSKVSNVIIDDVISSSELLLNKYINFFSQPNGQVIYGISANNIIEMAKNPVYNMNERPLLNSNLLNIKELDNPVIFIANFK